MTDLWCGIWWNANDFEVLRSQRRSTPTNRRQGRGHRKESACTRYGRKAHPREQCPARDATCHRCNKRGHFEAQCLTKLKPVSEVESEDELDTAFLGEVGSAKASVWSTTLQLNGHKIQFKLDTGAGATAISMETYNMLQIPKLKTPQNLLYGPSRQPLDCIGEFQGKFAYTEGFQQNIAQNSLDPSTFAEMAPHAACY